MGRTMLRPADVRTADAIADRFLAGRHIPALVYGVVVNGELIHSRGIGTLRAGEDARPDADSVFRIASMTKSFTAATVIRLRDEGRLSLDDPISRHVPELANLRGPTSDSPVITVRHLLTMTAGLATDDPWGDRQQGLDLAAFSELLRGPLTFAWAPGTRFEYSNLGYGILGRLITNVAGAEYREVVRARILEPLGMAATTYLEDEVKPDRLARGYLWRDDAYVDEPMDPYGALASMGGIFTTVKDLARWVGFFTDAYPPRDDPETGMALSRASRREMQQVSSGWWPNVTLPTPDADPEISAFGYGFGLFVEDHVRFGKIVAHSGGYPGFGSNMRWQPASGLGVVILANHRYAPTTTLARDLMWTLLEAGAVPPRSIRPAASLVAARRGIDRLLVQWDDKLAARLFAMNVALDEPLARRRDTLDRIRLDHGDLRPDPTVAEAAQTPLHAVWWLVGARGGRVRVEIQMSPQSPTLVQTFSVTSVPAPSRRLQTLADRIVAALNGPRPRISPALVLDGALDRAALDRVMRIVAVRFAPLVVGPSVAGDGTASATWRITGERGELELVIGLDPDGGKVTALSIVRRAPEISRHGD